MAKVLIYSGITALALIFGAIVGSYFSLKKKIIAAFMAFGAGVLVCALTFGLMEEAFSLGGFDDVIIGFLAGGAIFVLGDYLIHIFGGRRHRHLHQISDEGTSNGVAITFGAFLDGVPESIALGIALFAGKNLGLVMLTAIVLSNFPESISSVHGLIKEGYRRGQVICIWILVGLAAIGVTALSYLFFPGISQHWIGFSEAFAAGAILAMLADTMMPEAFEDGGPLIGMVTIFGFLPAFVLAKL